MSSTEDASRHKPHTGNSSRTAALLWSLISASPSHAASVTQKYSRGAFLTSWPLSGVSCVALHRLKGHVHQPTILRLGRDCECLGTDRSDAQSRVGSPFASFRMGEIGAVSITRIPDYYFEKKTTSSCSV
ncbi:hypothetical protein SKAU_G00130320 [Synaphobranchus kaupii]|uniref:Uncharacterized protein n=1 Tax=Synaphobranchus kaupii TaxID=118154 RepID=A0A9Q1FQU0_SYNKA|nr:hypothetical protein SKAU_G00130320 [Synaphobranchus kaupii]